MVVESYDNNETQPNCYTFETRIVNKRYVFNCTISNTISYVFECVTTGHVYFVYVSVSDIIYTIGVFLLGCR